MVLGIEAGGSESLGVGYRRGMEDGEYRKPDDSYDVNVYEYWMAQISQDQTEARVGIVWGRTHSILISYTLMTGFLINAIELKHPVCNITFGGDTQRIIWRYVAFNNAPPGCFQ
jgi:hypothetical protein